MLPTINTAKRRMLEGKPALGGAAGLGSPLSAELLALAGFHWVLVDNQHGRWEHEAIMAAFRSIRLAGSIPVARVQKNDFGLIGELLDEGALGIIVPLVNSAEDAKAAAYAMRYPPRGGRSIGAYGGLIYGPDYVQWANDEVFLAVQIETQQAVEHVEEILAVDGVDGCWIGPGDLAATMGVDVNTPAGQQAHLAAILRVLDACKKTNKIPGIYGVDDPEGWLKRGFLFVTVGGDFSYVLDGATQTMRRLQAFCS